MSDMMQVADTSFLKRKASHFLFDDEEILLDIGEESSEDMDQGTEDFDMTHGKILAKISDVSSGDVYPDCTDSKIMVQFMMRAIRSHSNLYAGNLSS